MTTEKRSLGATVQGAREKRGLTQAELAKLADCSREQIAKIECGTTEHPRPATLVALARALGLTVDALLTGLPR